MYNTQLLCPVTIFLDTIDDFVKSHQICFRWLSKNFDIQDTVIFQVRNNTNGMSSA
jgi:hypothetical protein